MKNRCMCLLANLTDSYSPPTIVVLTGLGCYESGICRAVELYAACKNFFISVHSFTDKESAATDGAVSTVSMSTFGKTADSRFCL